MNENLNLVEILKNCPKGMELDCTMYDNATFGGIIENGLYPIKVYVGDGPTMMLTKYGQYTDVDLAKCVIFPKGKTTWEGFVPPCEFKDGDILSYQTVRFATEEEKQKLFQAIKDNRYKWDAQTKTLKKLVKPKFDPKTLMAFDKVLVRLTKDCIWNATFFSHYDKEVNWGCYPCVTTSCKSYDKCIPYNNETKHLVGTDDEAPEYYRYWED